jgi:hypothetical protein
MEDQNDGFLISRIGPCRGTRHDRDVVDGSIFRVIGIYVSLSIRVVEYGKVAA